MPEIESKKTEIRYKTDDPKRMLGKWIVRNVMKTWNEDLVDTDTQEVVTIERNELLLERGTYIDQDVLSTISFLLSEGSVREIEVSNQNRQGVLSENRSLYPYKAAFKAGGKRKTAILYAVSVANALTIISDWVELNVKGYVEIVSISAMNDCVVIEDRLKSKDGRKSELDMAYLKGEISMEEFVEATSDMIQNGNPDMIDEAEEDRMKGMKFYQISANIFLNDEKEGEIKETQTFIVHTTSAVRANILIEKYLRDEQERRYQESLKHPERTFVKYEIASCIEESKILSIAFFIPESFSMVYKPE